MDSAEANIAKSTESARKSADPQWGGDTRDRATESLELAKFWVDAYGQLLEYDIASLNYMREHIEELPIPMRREVEETNIPILDAQIVRVRVRLAFWQDRRGELDRAALV